MKEKTTEKLVLVNFRLWESQQKAVKKLIEKYGGEARAYRAIMEKGLKAEGIIKSKKK